MSRGEPSLAPAVLEQVRRLGTVDILVGIPSYNNARTIGHVVRSLVSGLATHFPDARAVLVNSDGGSTDGTRDVVARTDPGPVPEILAESAAAGRIVTLYEGIPGKGSAVRTIFRIAAELRASACCVVDADLRSIGPVWVDRLLGPVVRGGFEFVAPRYLRYRWDGTITNTIVAPMTRTLWGRRIRQPIGGDFGFSGSLAERFLGFDGWDGPVARFGIDIFMTATALAEGRRVCEAHLGAKVHDAKDPAQDLPPMMVQVLSALFERMEATEERWLSVTGSEPVPIAGEPPSVRPEPIPVRLAPLTEAFQRGVRDLPPVWEAFLSPETLGELQRAAASVPGPTLSDESWASILFQAAAEWKRGSLPRETLIRSLVPLYLGKVGSLVSEISDVSDEEAENRFEALGETFERTKPLLCRLWREA
ncbi:MAG: glycosyltransferase family 2 protein [Thermoanaerobaculia bacterium]